MNKFLKFIYRNIREPIKKTVLFKKFEHYVVNNYFKCKYNITQDVFETNTQYFSYPRRIEIDGTELIFMDIVTSNTVECVKRELDIGDIYDFKNLSFKPGDVVLDIGANVGIVSIYLAKKFPFLKIYAFEPVIQNCENFKINMKMNNISNEIITVYNKAVTGDGLPVSMNINSENSGASFVSNLLDGGVTNSYSRNIESITLEQIFKILNLDKLKLLKIDCEGCEYDILKNTNPEILKQIEILRGEFHENKKVTDKYEIGELLTYIRTYVKDVKVEECKDYCFII